MTLRFISKLFLTMHLALGLTACSKINKTFYADDVLASMKDKYNVEFKWNEERNNGYNYVVPNERAYLLTPDDEDVHVWECDGVLYDDYHEYVMRPKIEEYVKDAFLAEFDSVKVFNYAGLFSEGGDFSEEETVEQYLADNISYQSFNTVYISESGLDKSEYADRVNSIYEQLYDLYNKWDFHVLVVSKNVFDGVHDLESSYEFRNSYQEKSYNFEPDNEELFYYAYLNLTNREAD